MDPLYYNSNMMMWRRNNYNWNMSVMYTIFTDTAKQLAPHRPYTAGTHNDSMRLVILCQSTDHLSRFVALLLVQLEIKLQTINRKIEYVKLILLLVSNKLRFGNCILENRYKAVKINACIFLQRFDCLTCLTLFR